jgi:hypothetical protein
MLTLDNVYRASHALKGVIRNTDVIYAPKLCSDAELYLKTENLQITGSFKVRGAYYKMSRLSDEQKAAIEKTAQGILDARAKYPDCSLADLYDEVAMPPELRKAHQENDRAVMRAYGFWGKLNTESECVAELMKMYQELTK